MSVGGHSTAFGDSYEGEFDALRGPLMYVDLADSVLFEGRTDAAVRAVSVLCITVGIHLGLECMRSVFCAWLGIQRHLVTRTKGNSMPCGVR